MMKYTILKILFFIIIAASAYVFKVQQIDSLHILTNAHSDWAILNLMALDIWSGKPVIYFYGQNYLGSLSSGLAALIQWLGFFQNEQVIHLEKIWIDPKSMMAAASFLVCSGVLLFALSVAKLYHWLLGLVVLFYGLFLNQYLSTHHFSPNLGDEMAIFFSGALCLSFAFFRWNFWSPLVLGLIAGLGWWMNQTVIFLLMPILIILFTEKGWLPSIAKTYFTDRLFFPAKESLVQKNLFRLGLIIFSIGFLVSLWGGVDTHLFGIKLKIGNGFSSIKTAIILWALVLIIRDFRSNFFRKIASEIGKSFYPFIVGFVVGYSPVVLGRFLGWYEKSYGVSFKPVSLFDIFPHILRLYTEFFPRTFSWGTGFTDLLISTIILSILGHFFVRKLSKKPMIQRRDIFGAAIILNILYVVLADRSRTEFALRYMSTTMIFVPVLLLSLYDSQRKALFNGILIVSITAIFSYFSIMSFQVSAPQRDSKTAQILIEKIKRVELLPCQVIKGDFWDVYLWEYLSARKVLAKVTEGQNRTWSRDEELEGLESCTISDL